MNLISPLEITVSASGMRVRRSNAPVAKRRRFSSRVWLAFLTTFLLAAFLHVQNVSGQDPPSHLLNISTRLRVQTEDKVLIGGFIIIGTEPKRVIIRAIGPSLAINNVPVPGRLEDPALTLHNQPGGPAIASNDNWGDAPEPERTEIENSGLRPEDSLESAIIRTLNPGTYTAIVHGKDGTTGIALVEAYDLNPASNSKLANISTRGFVDTGDNVMIGGFIVGPAGGAWTNFVVRAIGPSLTALGVPGALQDPTLTFHNANGTVLSENDDWQDTQPAEIRASGLQLNDSRESAILVALPPGVYTAIIRGKGNLTGISLVEIYHVPAPPFVIIPNPIDQAPAPPLSNVADFYDSTSFLYQGQEPLQLAVTPGTINPAAAAVIRGSVKQENDQPLAGVRISIQGRPEFGYTFTRANGQYDIAVNGGTVQRVDYQAAGYFPAQREVQVPQQNFVIADDVVMVAADPIGTLVTFGAAAPVQVAESSTRSDAAGSRSATMYFPAGTGAQLLYPNGTTQQVDSLTVRATEYTVGPNGPKKMPAALPGMSAYTYCVELSADEATAGAKSVVFDQELSVYLENFLGFDVGTLVPSGYYDREKKAWVPAENGIVAKVVSITNAVAALDLDGDGVAESDDTLNSNGISVNERERIAARFAAGATFWRMPVTHFTAWDFNAGPIQEPKEEPKGEPDKPPELPKDGDPDFGVLGLGSQVFREELPVAGTNLSLHYASDRVPGYRVNATLELPLFDAVLPPNITGAEIEVQIAGRTSLQTFTPTPNLIASFQWDGRDVYHPQTGNSNVPVGGSASALVSFFYKYPLSYQGTVGRGGAARSAANYVEAAPAPSGAIEIRSLPPIFALPGRDYATIVHSGTEEAIAGSFRRMLVVPDHRKAGFGGWSLTPHHYYDPTAKVLYRGDGTQIKTDAKGSAIDYVLRTPDLSFKQFAAAPDGNVYVAAPYASYQLFKITPAGQVLPVTNPIGTTLFLNPNSPSQELDNKLAADVSLSRGVHEMRAGPDGSIYLAFDDAGEAQGGSIWRLDRDERFHVVLCGSDASQANISPPDGTSARNAYWHYLVSSYTHIAIAKDGSVYYTDGRDDRQGPSGKFFNMIRKVAPDGRIYTIAGLGGDSYDDINIDVGQPALTARLRAPQSLAVGPDDSVYYASYWSGIVRITPGGLLEFVLRGLITSPAGLADADDRYTDEGKVAANTGTQAQGHGADDLAFSPDGTLYFRTDGFSGGPETVHWIWKIDPDGILRRVAGRWYDPVPGQTGSALLADVGLDVYALGFGPDGSLFFSGYDYSLGTYATLRRISSGLPGFTGSELLVASEDGQELYVFDQNGRHLRTIDPLLNVTTWIFNYDFQGFVSSLQDRNGLVTQIERNGSGQPVAVIGPYGTRTNLGLDANGYLANITAPDQTTIQMTNSESGLLQSITGPRQDTYSFTYDDMGRLTRGDHPSGGFTELVRTGSANDATITATTAGGRVEERRILRTDVGGTEITRTYPDELPTIETLKPDGGIIRNNLPVLKDEIDKSPDPRPNLAGQASYTSLKRITTPNGLKLEVNSSAQATFTSPTDPFSLSTFVETSSVNGKEWKNSYQAATRSFTIESPEDRKLVLQVDAAGRLSNRKHGDLAEETFSYDQFGRLTTLTAGSGAETRTATIGYDATGYVNFAHAPDGREAQITNDAFGRPTSVVLPGNRTVGFTYGVDGRLESVTPPGRPSYTYEYDVATGRITFKTPELTGVDNTTIVEQTLDRQFKSATLPGDRHLDFARSPSGKISSITNTFGDIFTYSYNTVGRISGINQPGVQTAALSYIGLNVSNVTWSGAVTGSLIRQFNNELLISSEAVNGATPVPFGYNNDRLMTSAGALGITWRDDVGLPAAIEIGNITTAYDYDAFGYPSRVIADFNGATLIDINETRDAGGRVVTRAETGALTSSYVYDSAGFLASISRNGTLVASYNYDSNGNIISAVTLSGSTSYAYDARDRLLTAGATTFAYTDAGELKTRVTPTGTTSYDYDELGQVRHVSLPDGRNIDYVLGMPGMRIAKKIDGAVVQGFLRDEKGKILAELDGNNAVVSRFVYSEVSETPAYMIRGSDTLQIITDSLGSVRLVVNAQTGAVVQLIDYDEWGLVTLDSNPGFQPFGFAGGIYDKDTGLVRFGARDYDPSVARWTAPDPLNFGGRSTNLYTYVGNDPVNQIDPSGTGPRGLEVLHHSQYSDGVNVRYSNHASVIPPATPLHEKPAEHTAIQNPNAENFREVLNDPTWKGSLEDYNKVYDTGAKGLAHIGVQTAITPLAIVAGGGAPISPGQLVHSVVEHKVVEKVIEAPVVHAVEHTYGAK